jgi:hypothetical protein
MTKTGIIEIVNDKKFNLDKTIYPSFNYSLIKKINNKYIVIHGKLKMVYDWHRTREIEETAWLFERMML